MRKWRIGSVSMGLCLILLGCIVFWSRVQDRPFLEPFVVWWPAIMIVLGLEIVLYVWFMRKDNPVLKYDFLSIVFVGAIGTIGIAFTLLSASGLLQELETAVAAETRTFDLPAVEQRMTDDIKRVILDPGSHMVNLEAGASPSVHVFGTYRATVAGSRDTPIAEASDYVNIHTAGDTMYLTLKDPSYKDGLFQTYTRMETTLIVPADVRLEVRGNHNALHLSVQRLSNDWLIHKAGAIHVSVRDQDDLLITASAYLPLDRGDWDTVETEADDSQPFGSWYSGVTQIGEGTYRLAIVKSELVTVDGIPPR